MEIGEVKSDSFGVAIAKLSRKYGLFQIRFQHFVIDTIKEMFGVQMLNPLYLASSLRSLPILMKDKSFRRQFAKQTSSVVVTSDLFVA